MKKPRNYIMMNIQKNDPGRFRSRVVKGERGKGRKDRPRNSNRVKKIIGE